MRPSRIAVEIAYALTMVLGVAAVVAALTLIRLTPDHRTDFLIFYRSALAWRTGGTMYPADHVNLNPPAVVVAYAPLTYVPTRTAQKIFTLLGVSCVIVSSRWITTAIPRTPPLVLASIVLAVDSGWINLWLEHLADLSFGGPRRPPHISCWRNRAGIDSLLGAAFDLHRRD